MTKNFLLAAASVAVLGFAGAAQAADITTLSFAGVTIADSTSPYAIGDVAENTGDTYNGDLAFEVTYDDNLPTANNLLITIRLGGGATFNEDVESADINGFSQAVISDGGEEGDAFVTFLVTAAAATDSFTIDPLNIAFEAGDAPTVSVETQTEAGNTAIEGRFAEFDGDDVAVLVDYLPVVAITITDDTTDPELSLSSTPIFTDFNNGVSSEVGDLGDISVTLNTVYLPDGSGNLDNTAVAPGVIDTVSVDIEGSETQLEVQLWEGVGDELDAADYTTLPFNADVVAVIDVAADPVPASSYSATVTVTFDDDDFEPVVAEDDLASIVREGVSAEIPWVASSALAARNSSTSVIRIANKSEEPAAVYGEVLTSQAAQGITPTGVATTAVLLGTAPAGGDLQVNTTLLTQRLGEFVRGNILISVEAAQEDVTVNNRISYSDGRIVETTVTDGVID